MLLRSSSTSILNSWLPNTTTKDYLSPESEFVLQTPISRARSLSTVSLSPSSFDESSKKITRALSESDLKRPLNSINKPMHGLHAAIAVDEEQGQEEEHVEPIWWLMFTSSGLDDQDCEVSRAGVAAEGSYIGMAEVLVDGGSGGSGGRRMFRGGGGGSDGGDGDGFWDFSGRINGTDVYYQQLIKANPGNPLLLSNYARFLKDVRRDFVKSEEYCSRAILANPSDANALSLYADLIWQSHKDASRAETYFDQAVKAAPDDCYVLASYAHFLWDADDEEDDEERQNNVNHRPPGFQGATHSDPIAAAF